MSASNMFNKTLQTSHRGVSLVLLIMGMVKHYITGILNTKPLVIEIRDEWNFLLDVTNFYLNNVF